MIYLASPYSHDDPVIREKRFNDVCLVAARLMEAGHSVFSPIAHTHPIACAGALPKGWDFWHNYDRWFIERATELMVLCLDGWQDSKGVTAEIAIAVELGKTVKYMDMEGLML